MQSLSGLSATSPHPESTEEASQQDVKRLIEECIVQANFLLVDCASQELFISTHLPMLVNLVLAVFPILDAHACVFTEEQLAPLLDSFHTAMDHFTRHTESYSTDEFSSGVNTEFLKSLITCLCTGTRCVTPHYPELATQLKDVHPAMRVLFYSLLFNELEDDNLKSTLCFLTLFEMPSLSSEDEATQKLNPIWRMVPTTLATYSLVNQEEDAPTNEGEEMLEEPFVRRLLECDVYQSDDLSRARNRLAEIDLLFTHIMINCVAYENLPHYDVQSETDPYLRNAIVALMAIYSRFSLQETDLPLLTSLPDGVFETFESSKHITLLLEVLYSKLLLSNVPDQPHIESNLYEVMFELDQFIMLLVRDFIKPSVVHRFIIHNQFPLIEEIEPIRALGEAADKLGLEDETRSKLVLLFPLSDNPITSLAAFAALKPPQTEEDAMVFVQLCFRQACFSDFARGIPQGDVTNAVDLVRIKSAHEKIIAQIGRIKEFWPETGTLMAARATCAMASVFVDILMSCNGSRDFEILVLYTATKLQKDAEDKRFIPDCLHKCMKHMQCSSSTDLVFKTFALFNRGIRFLPYSNEQLVDIYTRLIYTLSVQEKETKTKTDYTTGSKYSMALTHAFKHPTRVLITPESHMKLAASAHDITSMKERVRDLTKRAEEAEALSVAEKEMREKAEQEAKTAQKSLIKAEQKQRELKKEAEKKERRIQKITQENGDLKAKLAALSVELSQQVQQSEEEIARLKEEIEALQKKGSGRGSSTLSPDIAEHLYCTISRTIPVTPVVVSPAKAATLGLTGVNIAEKEFMVRYLKDHRGISQEEIEASLVPLPWLVPVLDTLREASPTSRVHLHRSMGAIPVVALLNNINTEVARLLVRCDGIKLPKGASRRLGDLKDMFQPSEQQRVRKLLQRDVSATVEGGAIVERIVSDLRVIAEGALKIALMSLGRKGHHPIMSAPGPGNILRDSHKLATLLEAAARELRLESQFEDELERLKQDGWEYYRTEYAPIDPDLPRVYQLMYTITTQLASDPSPDKKLALATTFSEEVIPSVTYLFEVVLKLLQSVPSSTRRTTRTRHPA